MQFFGLPAELGVGYVARQMRGLPKINVRRKNARVD